MTIHLLDTLAVESGSNARFVSSLVGRGTIMMFSFASMVRGTSGTPNSGGTLDSSTPSCINRAEVVLQLLWVLMVGQMHARAGPEEVAKSIWRMRGGSHCV